MPGPAAGRGTVSCPRLVRRALLPLHRRVDSERLCRWLPNLRPVAPPLRPQLHCTARFATSCRHRPGPRSADCAMFAKLAYRLFTSKRRGCDPAARPSVAGLPLRRPLPLALSNLAVFLANTSVTAASSSASAWVPRGPMLDLFSTYLWRRTMSQTVHRPALPARASSYRAPTTTAVQRCIPGLLRRCAVGLCDRLQLPSAPANVTLSTSPPSSLVSRVARTASASCRLWNNRATSTACLA